MLFFQFGFLLAGYAYAHGIATWFRDRKCLQVGIHLALILISLAILPITPDPDLKPTPETNPAWGIIILLLQTVGLPFIVVSASGPLLQHWFASAFAGASPYRLYAISNVGSLLGLISYPFLIEPLVGLRLQTQLWSGTYVLYGLLAAFCAWLMLSRSSSQATDSSSTTDTAPAPAPAIRNRFLWGAFATLGSVLLLASTNQMCQDIVVIPFLWVLPSVFTSSPSSSVSTIPAGITEASGSRSPPHVGGARKAPHEGLSRSRAGHHQAVAIYMAAMFTCCMVCHGEMVRLNRHRVISPHSTSSSRSEVLSADCL